MRVLLAGSPAARARLRTTLDAAGIEVAGEFASFATARASRLPADAIVVAPVDRDVDTDLDSAEPVDAREELTPREIEVVELLAEGLPNKAIAARLGISDQTVKFHVASIYGKLGAANRTDAVRRAARRGLIAL